jgi:Asp-tRNA(Asn)/Glu-tRNA(Gln) amidotransferase A subunit family amidase
VRSLTSGARLLAGQVSAGRVSAAETTREALAAADDASGLGAFWFLDRNGAAAAARAVDATIRQGCGGGRLAGIPIAVKDAFDVSGMPGGAGGPVRVAQCDADVVARCRSEGAIILGKAAMHQLGWGMTGQCPGRPLCRNPLASDRQPGGSSSGSAAAVAAGIVPLALGADTGGSVRLPAAWCGVVGFKPSQGTVSRQGVAPVARALDTVGYLGTSVDDCQLAYEVLAEGSSDPFDPANVDILRVATDPALLEGTTQEVMEAFLRGLQALRDAGAKIVREGLPPHRVPLGALYAASLATEWGAVVDAMPEIFGDDVKAGVCAGRAVSNEQIASGWAARDRLRHNATLSADVFVCPATPMVAPPLDAPDDVARAGRYLRPFNVLDWSAIVVPCPASSSVGLQLAAPAGREQALLALAKVVEAAA